MDAIEYLAYQLYFIILTDMFVISPAFGIACSIIAYKKGRSGLGWFFFGYFTGIVALILIITRASLKYQKETNEVEKDYALSEKTEDELKKELSKLKNLHEGMIISDEEYLEKKTQIEEMLKGREQFRRIEGRDQLFSVSPTIQELIDNKNYNKDQKIQILRNYLNDKTITIDEYDYALKKIR